MTGTTDLDGQVRDAHEQLTALSRRVRELAEMAGEADRDDVVDGLSDVALALNEAAEAFLGMAER